MSDYCEEPEEPEEIMSWAWPDTEHVPDGYNYKELPKLTETNFRMLIDEHNKLVAYVKDKLGS